MPKSIYLTDEQYQQVTEAARRCGYRVERGRGSELAKFVVDASETKVEVEAPYEREPQSSEDSE